MRKELILSTMAAISMFFTSMEAKASMLGGEILNNDTLGVGSFLSTKFGLLLPLVVFLILLVVIVSLLIRLKKGTSKVNLLNKQISDIFGVLTNDSETDLFQVDNVTGRVCKYESGQYRHYSDSIEAHIKNIYTRDLKVLKELIDGISVKKKDYVTAEFRYFNASKKKYCYYEFVFLVTERSKEGKVLSYIFSKRDCSLVKEAGNFQQNLLNNLNHSMAAGELSRWFYDIKKQQCNIIEYKGTVYEYDYNLIDYVCEKDREKVRLYIADLIAGRNTALYVEARIFHLEAGNEHLCRLSGTVEYDSEKKPVFIHGIWRDITEIYNINKELEDFKRNTTIARNSLTLLRSLTSPLYPLGVCSH